MIDFVHSHRNSVSVKSVSTQSTNVTSCLSAVSVSIIQFLLGTRADISAIACYIRQHRLHTSNHRCLQAAVFNRHTRPCSRYVFIIFQF